MKMEITGTDSNINKLANDKEVRISPVSDLSANAESSVATQSANPSLKKDGTNLNTSKGKIPASGFLLSDANTPSFVKNAEQVIQQYSGDSRKLEIINHVLEKLNLNEGLDNLTDEDMMALMMLGFDLQVDFHGQVIIKEISTDNEIKPADFAKLQTNLKNTVKRTMASTDISPAGKVSALNSRPVAPPVLNSAAQEALINTLKDYHQNNQYNKEVVEPKNVELEQNIHKYEAMLGNIEKQTNKIDNSIGQIVSLKTQAEALMGKAKGGIITDLEKKQLLNLAVILDIKQKELNSNQKDTELLMNQAEQTFAQFAPNLPEGERETKALIQSTLKDKVSGASLTIAQDGVDNIIKEIYKRTAGMGEGELEGLMKDKDSRMKLMSGLNKFFDKIGSATKLSDLSHDDLDTLWKDYKFKAVEENGKLEYYYYADDKAKPVIVTKEDIRGFKTQLNNIVNSPELFQIARAAGQISLAYDKEGIKKENVEARLSGNTAPKEPANFKKAGNDDSELHGDKNSQAKVNSLDDEISQKVSRWTEQSNLDKSIQRKKDEEKYHEKQIDNIHESRREVNRYLDKKRVVSETEKDRLNKH